MHDLFQFQFGRIFVKGSPRDSRHVTVVTLTIHFTRRMQSNFAQVQSCLDSVSRSRSQSWSQVDFRVLVLRRLRLRRWRRLSLTPMYASQSHNYSFNFCCKVSGNQTLFFNNLKKTKVLLTKVKTRSELYYRADRTDESLKLSVGIQFQSYLPFLSFVQISSKLLKLGLYIHVGWGSVEKFVRTVCLLHSALSLSWLVASTDWHWLARSSVSGPGSGPQVSPLSPAPAPTIGPSSDTHQPTLHWHRLDTTGSVIISQLGFTRYWALIILSCQQRISTISLSFC